jgi:hypothetical protein
MQAMTRKRLQSAKGTGQKPCFSGIFGAFQEREWRKEEEKE